MRLAQGNSPGAQFQGAAATAYACRREDRQIGAQVAIQEVEDIMSPGIDGLDTYKRILNFRPGQKAIIASGYSETDRVKEAQKLGAGAYVKKPYILETIGMKVKEELNRTNPS